jgi:hypothetical protein
VLNKLHFLCSCLGLAPWILQPGSKVLASVFPVQGFCLFLGPSKRCCKVLLLLSFLLVLSCQSRLVSPLSSKASITAKRFLFPDWESRAAQICRRGVFFLSDFPSTRVRLPFPIGVALFLCANAASTGKVSSCSSKAQWPA